MGQDAGLTKAGQRSAKAMRTGKQLKITLGDLVVAVFEEASRHGRDPREVSRLAILTLSHILRGSENADTASLVDHAAPADTSHGLEIEAHPCTSMVVDP